MEMMEKRVYQTNSILVYLNGYLYRSKRIATNFDEELAQIKKKFLAPDFPPFLAAVCV